MANDRLRLLFCDHLNLARGKYVPASFASKGAARLCLGAYAVTYLKDLIPAPGAGVLEGLPDIEIVFDPENLRPGWEKNTQIALGDLELEGKPFVAREFFDTLNSIGNIPISLGQWEMTGENGHMDTIINQ